MGFWDPGTLGPLAPNMCDFCCDDNLFKQLVRKLRDRVAAMVHHLCDVFSRLSKSWQPHSNLTENGDSHPTKQCPPSVFLKNEIIIICPKIEWIEQFANPPWILNVESPNGSEGCFTYLSWVCLPYLSPFQMMPHPQMCFVWLGYLPELLRQAAGLHRIA